jgi:hypothetical protein
MEERESTIIVTLTWEMLGFQWLFSNFSISQFDVDKP